MLLPIHVNGVTITLNFPHLTEGAYKSTRTMMARALQDGAKNREAIAQSYLALLAACPSENASDLWHHVIYRLYCEILPNHRRQNPQQSWVRASGEALELVVEALYTPVLKRHGVRLEALLGGRRAAVLDEMGLSASVGKGKLDVAIHVDMQGTWSVLGGIHVKASLAERVSDDVPASRAMIERGYFSPLWTMDVKSFPPPQGDLINRGELGTPARPSEKRRYVEEHGDFDNCYSANSRTYPTIGPTPSGQKVYRLDLSSQPDLFAKDLIKRALIWRARQ